MIIGLTGLYCAGKNHIALLLEKRGIPVLDLDKLGHEAINLEKEQLIQCFGKEILGEDGLPDRRRLGNTVFGKPEALASLEAIIHPVVNRLSEEWTARRTGLCVVNAAVLHKSSIINRLDAIIVVRCPLPIRFFRAKRRDKLPLGELVKRFSSQKDFPRYTAKIKTENKEAKLFLLPADIYIMENSGFSGSRQAAADLEKRIDAILEGLYGKEKAASGCGYGGRLSGDCIQRRDPDF